MEVLLDTNVLIALLNPASPENARAQTAIEVLAAEGSVGWLAPQVLAEFWVVATRPVAVNGLGWSVARTQSEIRSLLAGLPVLVETPELLAAWLDLAARHGVIGKQVHDARLAALMQMHGVIHILTFNTADFPAAWGVTAVAPGFGRFSEPGKESA